MTTTELALLLLAGVGAGIVGSTAGLASLVSYPALLLTGLPPVTANVTNTISLLGSSIGSVLGSRRELAGTRRWVVRQLPSAVLGGALGGVLLLISPPGSFESVVPFLIALAAAGMLAGPRIRLAAARRRGDAPPGARRWVSVALVPCFVYAGYFGAAAGVMILAIMLIGSDRTLPVSNALKNLTLGVANAVAGVTFAFSADVSWPSVPPLLLGCVVGGWIGPAIVRRVPPDLLRWVIGLAGLGLAVRLWFS